MQSTWPHKKWKKYFKSLSFNVLAVLMSIKRSYIWDIGPKIERETEIIEFVNKVNEVLKENLQVLFLNMDISISNSKNTPLPPIFIDISNEIPKIINEQHQKEIFKKQNGKLQNLENLKLNLVGVCVPSMIGFLIGYPIIYWFNYDKFFLDGIELKVYKIFLFNNLVMSFSFPRIFENDNVVIKVISEWENSILKNDNDNIRITNLYETKNFIIL